MKKSNLMPSVVLGVICLVVALLLSVVNMFTAPVIEEAQNAAANAALLEVLPNGENFEEIELTADYPAVVTAGYKADGGYVFKMSVVGYKPGLVIMCGIDSDGKIVGVKHIQSSETYGLEGELNGAYVGDSLDSLELVIAAGATSSSKTSKAYYDAVKAALQSYILATGGSVDTRSPEQILNDNLNAALGTVGKAFNEWFATEALEGVSAVYITDGGYVFKAGQSYVGVNSDGEIVTAETGADVEATVNAAYTAMMGSSLSEVTDLPSGITAQLLSAHVTASGNYVLVTTANGFGGVITVKTCISSDGKIIATKTESHSETAGYGKDALENPDFYDRFNGTDSESCGNVTNAAGATVTSTAYKNAVSYAFEVFEILTAEGENE